MRSIWRTPDTRDIALVCLADAIVGASFGAIAVGTGLPLWLPVVLSVVVFAGAAQFIVIGVLAAGGNPVAAVVSALLVNTRLIPLGFSVGDVLAAERPMKRAVGTHLITDETVAFTMSHRDPDRRTTTYWLGAVGLFVAWNIGVSVGVAAGGAITDTSVLGLDAAFPAVLIALVAPALRDPVTRKTALAGGVIAVVASSFLPAGIPVLLALLAVLPAYRSRKTAS